MRGQRKTAVMVLDTLALILMAICSALQFNVTIPSGSLHVSLVGMIAIALLALTEVGVGLLVSLVAIVLIAVLHLMTWPTAIAQGLLVGAGALIVYGSLPRRQRLSHQQTIWLGLAVGISAIILLTIEYLIIGWRYFGNSRGALVEIQQVFPAALLSGLLAALVVPALVFAGSRLGARIGLFVTPDDHDRQDPPLIDLSDHRDETAEQKKKDEPK